MISILGAFYSFKELPKDTLFRKAVTVIIAVLYIGNVYYLFDDNSRMGASYNLILWSIISIFTSIFKFQDYTISVELEILFALQFYLVSYFNLKINKEEDDNLHWLYAPYLIIYISLGKHIDLLVTYIIIWTS